MTKEEKKYIDYILKTTSSFGIHIYDERVEDDSKSYINSILRKDEGGEIYINNYIPNSLGMINYSVL